MSTVEEPETWQPDPALYFTARARAVPISQLSPPDRSWIVASLTARGWTVAAIAERLVCSLRLVQTIKAEPMTKVAAYAITMELRARAESNLRHLESRVAAQALEERDQRIAALTRQRDGMLDQLVRLQREVRNGKTT